MLDTSKHGSNQHNDSLEPKGVRKVDSFKLSDKGWQSAVADFSMETGLVLLSKVDQKSIFFVSPMVKMQGPSSLRDDVPIGNWATPTGSYSRSLPPSEK